MELTIQHSNLSTRDTSTQTSSSYFWADLTSSKASEMLSRRLHSSVTHRTRRWSLLEGEKMQMVSRVSRAGVKLRIECCSLSMSTKDRYLGFPTPRIYLSARYRCDW